MNNTMRIGIAAAVVAVAAALGFSYFVAPNIGGPGPTPTPTPSPRALDAAQGALEAGTYQFTVLDGVNVTLTVPEGWGNVQGYGVVGEGATVVVWPSDAEAANVYADPCRWQDGFVDPPVGPSVDDLATALADQPQRGDGVPIDVSIDGHAGKMIELSVPDGISFADCDGGQFHTWQGRFQQAPGQVDRVHILDVGGQRVVIDAHFVPGTSDAELAEQQAIMDTIQLALP